MTDAPDAWVQAWILYGAFRNDRFAATQATLGSDAAAWACYQAFFEAAAAHACGLWPDMHGGVVHLEAVLKPFSAAI